MSMPSSLRDGAYRRWLSADLSALIESKDLSLSTINKSYLRSRWLVQILQLEQDTTRARQKFQALRLINVIGSLLLVMLVTLRFDDAQLGGWAARLYYMTIVLSLLVAASVAVEHMFNFGEQARTRASMLDRLKTEGWSFLQLSGRYSRFGSHEEAFPAFANQVESLSRHEREVFIPEIVRDRRVESEAGDAAPVKKPSSYSPTGTGAGRASTVSTQAGVRTLTPSHSEPDSIQ